MYAPFVYSVNFFLFLFFSPFSGFPVWLTGRLGGVRQPDATQTGLDSSSPSRVKLAIVVIPTFSTSKIIPSVAWALRYMS